MTAISLGRVSKTFPGGVHALDSVDLEVGEGEFVAILGPSGCGKSTLLRIVAGLEEASSGRVETGDGIGVVFQTSNLLPWLTVEQNVGLGAQLKGRKVDTAPMLETLGLSAFARKYPHELSGGMRQRAALGQTLICEPRIVLLDEPFGALDALTRDRLNVELLRLWQDLRQTVVLITHSIPEAVFLADRVVVMTGRPGAVAEEMRVEIPRPRDPAVTRGLPEFAEAVLHLSKLMGVV
ncbi:ABC transporter ATP-binding protein [Nonomuraea sp. NPDC050310]|uniref:ABC transporter ATP-binding protein n=1 Tax=unclassified Nonomuraea TaxID=2593643 RepID=UPI0033EAB7F7